MSIDKSVNDNCDPRTGRDRQQTPPYPAAGDLVKAPPRWEQAEKERESAKPAPDAPRR